MSAAEVGEPPLQGAVDGLTGLELTVEVTRGGVREIAQCSVDDDVAGFRRPCLLVLLCCVVDVRQPHASLAGVLPDAGADGACVAGEALDAVLFAAGADFVVAFFAGAFAAVLAGADVVAAFFAGALAAGAFAAAFAVVALAFFAGAAFVAAFFAGALA
ncbi:MAG TPA: hypothetical protein PLO87_04500, partial [Ornithinibacter sp.]|nr:hypothetical protein [Ornithinibacter sp.]